MYRPNEKEWQDLESQVKSVAQYLYSNKAAPERINGVNFDCVIRIKPNYWILVEATLERDLGKLRNDLAKFAVARPHLMSQNIFCDCFFVTKKDPPPSLIETGKGSFVEVCSLRSFGQKLFDFGSYCFARSAKKFGSAVDPFSGEKDLKPYIKVNYEIEDGTPIDLDQLAKVLKSGKKIVLLGNYGTGKSRCIQELFQILSNEADQDQIYPIAINLHENWGLMRETEILRRLFGDLGLTDKADSLLKIHQSEYICYLLDGFDEIGTQVWSNNPSKLYEIREKSLRAVKELVQSCKGGFIITGRPHYFNSNSEMLRCLGLSEDKTIIIHCRNELNEPELLQYFSTREITTYLPEWLPKRPLICQIIASFEDEFFKRLFGSAYGQSEFWDILINTICDREVRINTSLESHTVKSILKKLARLTRSKPNNVGPISTQELNDAFFEIVGQHPIDASALVLQRLATLGRVGSESQDRQFIDEYILDGLRADDLIESISTLESKIKSEPWMQTLGPFGATIVANYIHTNSSQQSAIVYFNKSKDAPNTYLISDLIYSFIQIGDWDWDFENCTLNSGWIFDLDFRDSNVKKIIFRDCWFVNVRLGADTVENVRIENCEIENCFGVSSSRGAPSWIKNCKIGKFESVDTLAKIKKAELSQPQLILVMLLRKLFMQPGSARKEHALVRGFSSQLAKTSVDKILALLKREGIISTGNGREGTLYVPERKHASRVKKIMDELETSKDALWNQVSSIS